MSIMRRMLKTSFSVNLKLFMRNPFFYNKNTARTKGGWELVTTVGSAHIG